MAIEITNVPHRSRSFVLVRRFLNMSDTKQWSPGVRHGPRVVLNGSEPGHAGEGFQTHQRDNGRNGLTIDPQIAIWKAVDQDRKDGLFLGVAPKVFLETQLLPQG